MATAKEIEEFITKIAPCAQKAYKELGKVLPSICIGMACVESAYGKAGSAKYNSFMGFKVGSGKTATKYWPGKFFKSKTKEEYTVGTHTIITDAFRAYDSMEQCVFNFYELLNTSHYKRVTSGVDYAIQMNQIKQCGYMTSSTEVNSVCKLIQKYNLTKYDDFSTLPTNSESQTEKPKKVGIYEVGKIYTLNSNMVVRDSPNGAKVKFEDMTESGKAHGHASADGGAVLDKGTRVTCKDAVNKGGRIWIRIPSGWICAVGGTGIRFVI